MVKIDTKTIQFFIFQCKIGVFHKLNEENVMHSAGHRKIINNIKRFVRILLKLPTKKFRESTQEKIFPLYEQFLLEWKIIFSVTSLERYYFYYART